MIDENPSTETADGAPPRHRSLMMALSALTTLLVAAWCLAGGPSPFTTAQLPLILLVVGAVVGVGLIASGFRRS
ncbi:MAG: hypothetical protein WBA05_00260 [Gordonia sp. (in: high G+C Gram-positive bacteria)]|uniref:hypothetical protein n=1 Tax=Gordonia sp. (in: high G+C Gram-positive bacteria) TaxID=84139 RepID=UPI003C74E8AB